MKRLHSVPPMMSSPILESALSNFLRVCSVYALRFAGAGPKSPSPDACVLLVENTSVKDDANRGPGMTGELVTTDDGEISSLRLNVATMRDALHTRTSSHGNRRIETGFCSRSYRRLRCDESTQTI
jgi:hypothetical protein